MKKLSLMAAAFMILCVPSAAHAQQIDVAIGFSSLLSPSASSASSGYFPQSEGGGLYPGFSGNVMIKRNFGFNAEVAWRAGQGSYAGYQPFRTIFYDFNGVWAPRLTKQISGELIAGIGGESVRFYTNQLSCDPYTGICNNYVSSNHFMGDFGGGLRYYVWHNVFVRPEARLYLIHNNVEFSSGRALRYGVSVGYTFGRE
jgi:hypothetical protein